VAAGLLDVFEASVPRDLLRAADPELQAFYEGPSVKRVEGLFAHWFGVSTQASAARIVLVSGWDSEDALVDFVRANRLPRRTGPIAEIVTRGATERWELLDQVVSTFEPADASVLRLIRAPVPPDQLDTVLAELAAVRIGVPSRRDVAVSQVATRQAGAVTELLVLTAWRDESAVTDMLDRVAGWWGALARAHHLAGVRVETFALRPSGLLRLAPRGPAVVITDDRGVIVDATPAAVGMLGRSVWDLFQLRFDDLSRQLDDGTALIARPEGGSAHVHVLRAANMPAPGRHAALLIAAFEPRPEASTAQEMIARAYRRGPAESWREEAPAPAREELGPQPAPLPAPSVR
jgi:PAS domain-containing protein